MIYEESTWSYIRVTEYQSYGKESKVSIVWKGIESINRMERNRKIIADRREQIDGVRIAHNLSREQTKPTIHDKRVSNQCG